MGFFDTLKVMKDIVAGGIEAYNAGEKLDALIERTVKNHGDILTDDECALHKQFKRAAQAYSDNDDTDKNEALLEKMEDARIVHSTALAKPPKNTPRSTNSALKSAKSSTNTSANNFVVSAIKAALKAAEQLVLPVTLYAKKFPRSNERGFFIDVNTIEIRNTGRHGCRPHAAYDTGCIMRRR